MIRYAALRLSLLVVVGGLLYVAGMRGVLLAGTSIIVAALVAYIFFPGERDKAAGRLQSFRDKEEKPRIPDEDMEIEDAAVDDAFPEVDDDSPASSIEQPPAANIDNPTAAPDDTWVIGSQESELQEGSDPEDPQPDSDTELN